MQQNSLQGLNMWITCLNIVSLVAYFPSYDPPSGAPHLPHTALYVEEDTDTIFHVLHLSRNKESIPQVQISTVFDKMIYCPTTCAIASWATVVSFAVGPPSAQAASAADTGTTSSHPPWDRTGCAAHSQGVAGRESE